MTGSTCLSGASVPAKEQRLLDAWARCAIVDIDDNGVIDAPDVKAIESARGTVPGPSGFLQTDSPGRPRKNKGQPSR